MTCAKLTLHRVFLYKTQRVRLISIAINSLIKYSTLNTRLLRYSPLCMGRNTLYQGDRKESQQEYRLIWLGSQITSRVSQNALSIRYIYIDNNRVEGWFTPPYVWFRIWRCLYRTNPIHESVSCIVSPANVENTTNTSGFPTLPAYVCRLYATAFRVSLGRCRYWPPYPAMPPEPLPVRQTHILLSASPHGEPPCRSANTSRHRVRRGLTSPSRLLTTTVNKQRRSRRYAPLKKRARWTRFFFRKRNSIVLFVKFYPVLSRVWTISNTVQNAALQYAYRAAGES